MHDAPDAQVTLDLIGKIDSGERAAIELAIALRVDLVLMDDRAGVNAAIRSGLKATGTLGILCLAAKQGLVRLPAAFALLRQTNFRCPEGLMDELLDEQRRRART